MPTMSKECVKCSREQVRMPWYLQADRAAVKESREAPYRLDSNGQKPIHSCRKARIGVHFNHVFDRCSARIARDVRHRRPTIRSTSLGMRKPARKTSFQHSGLRTVGRGETVPAELGAQVETKRTLANRKNPGSLTTLVKQPRFRNGNDS
ncbi:uncharacterized protein BDR25DRAFT_31710 [Lindgomyces ingoldianus]|uniref:Uncharacterized protein n=1 Tax=Lindgomyces ingoldianus TaxID=673940 RepID=A0ACB6QX69_9PLEO|nr:uncharacterized protein BDR25DRAFT_31710 [Lindgomyces ingoldianus]KAF2470675.1 hypothetical protein BDR25DRAFT_31710 [Lindgomyces ingoldianus]